MIDEVYRNSLKEVYDVLENTDVELVNKIPNKFLNFIKENMNVNYITHINPNVEISKQPLLKETEAIFSLIYRSYWLTDGEKQEFSERDKEQLIQKEEQKKAKYKDISSIFPPSRTPTSSSTNKNLQTGTKINNSVSTTVEKVNFQTNTNINNSTSNQTAEANQQTNTSLITFKKENFFSRIFNKIINLFKQKK